MYNEGEKLWYVVNTYSGHELNVKEKQDSDQIVVTSDGKVEAAFLRNNFCYRKSANSEEIEII